MHRSSRGTAFASAILAFTVVMMGTTLPTPLYAFYAAELHFDITTTTVIYAVYAGGVIAALIGCGRWSDVIGRRPLLLAGAVLSAASAVVFLTAGPVWQLMLGRVLSGLSAGLYVGTATAAILELAPPSWQSRAPSLATAANIGGLGLGPLVAGLFAQFAPAPLRLPFVLNLVLLAVVLVGIWFIDEPGQVKPGARLGIQRLSVPTVVRGPFVRGAIAAFAGFAVLGSFTGVAPAFLSGVLDIHNHFVAGLLVAVLFLTSALTQIVGRALPTQHALIAGCAVLLAGVGVVIAGLLAESVALLFAGAAITGVGQGLSFSKGLAAVVTASPVDRRAEVTSTFFVVVYIAISLPIVGEGIAAAHLGLRTAGITLNVAVAVLAVIALILTVLAVRRDHTVHRNHTAED